MNIYDLAETVIELCKLAAQTARLQGYTQSARRMDQVRRELEAEVRLVEAREMVDPFDAA